MVEGVLHSSLALRVQGARGFVKYEQRRPPHQRPRECDALPLAAREEPTFTGVESMLGNDLHEWTWGTTPALKHVGCPEGFSRSLNKE